MGLSINPFTGLFNGQVTRRSRGRSLLYRHGIANEHMALGVSQILGFAYLCQLVLRCLPFVGVHSGPEQSYQLLGIHFGWLSRKTAKRGGTIESDFSLTLRTRKYYAELPFPATDLGVPRMAWGKNILLHRRLKKMGAFSTLCGNLKIKQTNFSFENQFNY